jgi:hypothetical protein
MHLWWYALMATGLSTLFLMRTKPQIENLVNPFEGQSLDSCRYRYAKGENALGRVARDPPQCGCGLGR